MAPFQLALLRSYSSYFAFYVLTILLLRSTPHCLEFLTIARLFSDSMAYQATWAFCSGENFKYRPREGLESCFELYSDARRADTFRLALFIVCDFTVLDKGPLGSGRDVDLTEKYFSNAMIEPEHIVE